MLGKALPPCGPKVTQPEMSAALQRLENLGQISGHLHREVSDLGAFHSGLSWKASVIAALGLRGAQSLLEVSEDHRRCWHPRELDITTDSPAQ